MEKRLPSGEETLPIIEVEGKFLTLEELKQQYPELYESLFKGVAGPPPQLGKISDELLIERFRMRMAQGRESTIYRLQYELTPEEQLMHMEARDEIGLELIEAERKLLEEELRILGG